MRLLVKTSLYYLVISLLCFTVAGIIILLNYSHIIDEDVNDFLINREEIATTQIINEVPIASLNNYEQIIKRANSKRDLDRVIFKDTTLYDIIEDQFHKYRKLNVTRKIGSTYYDITIFKSLIQNKILVKEVLKSMLMVFLGLLVFLILGNLFISRVLWKPFKTSLAILQNYELGSTKSVDFSKTNTKEFKQLNTMLNTMIKKIHYDYLNLKEFTENAAHEIQTPLAIIRNKCEILLQSSRLNTSELEQTQTIYNSCLRLSKINRGLSLLAKIESGSYESENVNVTEILKAQIRHYEEVIALNHLDIQTSIANDINHDINPELAEILMSNLIRNTIKHNISEGKIEITVTNRTIEFTNTGEPKAINKNQFRRFQRSDTNSLGLGLSIITKICRIHHITLTYNYDTGKHHFKLIF